MDANTTTNSTPKNYLTHPKINDDRPERSAIANASTEVSTISITNQNYFDLKTNILLFIHFCSISGYFCDSLISLWLTTACSQNFVCLQQVEAKFRFIIMHLGNLLDAFDRFI